MWAGLQAAVPWACRIAEDEMSNCKPTFARGADVPKDETWVHAGLGLERGRTTTTLVPGCHHRSLAPLSNLFMIARTSMALPSTIQQDINSGWTWRAGFWPGSRPAKDRTERSWPGKILGRSELKNQARQSFGPVLFLTEPTEQTDNPSDDLRERSSGGAV